MKVDGYACDQCNQFSRDRAGWVRVIPLADVVSQEGGGVEVCGPACLLKMARELVKAETNGIDTQELEHQAKQAVIKRRNGIRNGVRQRVLDGSFTEAEHKHKHIYPSQKSSKCHWCQREAEDREASTQVQ